MKRGTFFAAGGVFVVLGVSACAGDVEPRSAAERGRELLSNPKLSSSTLNFASCTTCHRVDDSDRPEAILPGVVLAGATQRPTFWAGQEFDLLQSINQCRFYFMSSNTPWTPQEENAKSIYAYLLSLESRASSAQRASIPFTMVRDAADVPASGAAAGEAIYNRACKTCHGTVHQGVGRLRQGLPVLPEETVERHRYLNSRDATRLAFIQKTRHGGFLGYGGTMPPFSLEVMSDADLGSLLAFLGLY